MWKTVDGAVEFVESEKATSLIPALIAVFPVPDPPPEYEMVSPVAPWYEVLHF